MNEMLWNRLEERRKEKKHEGRECGEEGEGGKETVSEDERTKQDESGKKGNQRGIEHTPGNGILVARNRERGGVVKSLRISQQFEIGIRCFSTCKGNRQAGVQIQRSTHSSLSW